MSNEYYQKALQHHQVNELDLAQELYKQSYEFNPNHFETLFLLGTCHIQLNNMKQAIFYLGQARKQRKDNEHVLMNLGIAYRNIKDFDAALQLFTDSLKINPSNADAHNNIGTLYEDQGMHLQSIEAFSQALTYDPSNEAYLINRAKALSAYKIFTKAAKDFKQIPPHSPYYSQAQYELFNILIVQESIVEAIKLGDSLIADHDQLDNIIILKKLIECALTHSQTEKAMLYLQRLKANDPDYKFYQAMIYQKSSRNDEAIKIYQELLQSGYTNASVYQNLAYEFARLNQHKLAQDYCIQAIDSDKDNIDARINLGISQLGCRNFLEGWTNLLFLKKKFGTYSKLDDSLPLWNGKSNTSRVLIYLDQGVGDQIFYGQLLSAILSHKNSFTIISDKRLTDIYKKVLPVNFSFITAEQANPINDNFDCYCSGIDLGKLFIQSPDDLINLNKLTLVTRKPIAKSNCLTGISWFSKNSKFGREKSLDLDTLIQHLGPTRRHFVNLQYGNFTKELTKAMSKHNVSIDGIKSDNLNNLDQLMETLASCNHVITISNTTAHLAGAMGVKTTLLLPSNHQCHSWYWSLVDNSNCSLWYPSVEVHQARLGESIAQVLKTIA